MTDFDPRLVRTMNPGDVLTITGNPGLRIEASEKFRTWVYRYRSPTNGAMRQVKIGRWPDTSLHAAIVAWEGLKRRRDAGEDPAADIADGRKKKREDKEKEARAKAEAAITVSFICDRYLDEVVKPNWKETGYLEVKRMFSTMLTEIGAAPAVSVTRNIAFNLIMGFAKTAPVQAAKLRAQMGAVWDHAIDAGLIPDSTPNWWRMILRGKIKSRGKVIKGEAQGTKKRVLDGDEVGELIRWLPNFPQSTNDVLTMYLWTTCRGAQITAMEGHEVVEEAPGQWWWTIPKSKTKNARHENACDERVPLIGRALAITLRRKQVFGDGYLYPSKGGKNPWMNQDVVQVRVHCHQPYCETRPEWVRPRLPVSYWSPHDLRRTSRTMLARIGCPEEVAEAIMGHMKEGVVGIYNLHTYDTEKREWLAKLSDYLESLAEINHPA